MRLPFEPPVEPMLAKPSSGLPDGEGWLYEPKWDGFRALVFRDGDETYIQSRDLKPLGRYFPELEQTLRERLPARCVLDGEVVIARDGKLDFEAMLLRIHPARSRVELLARQTPASFVAFDLLGLGDEDLRARPQHERREEDEEHGEPEVEHHAGADAIRQREVAEHRAREGDERHPIAPPLVGALRARLQEEHRRERGPQDH